MVQLRRWSKDDVNCLTHTGTQGLTLTNVTNQPKDFIAYNDEFSPSKYESEEKGYNWEARITYMLNGSSLVQIAPQFPSSGIVHYLYSQPDLTNDLGFDVSFALGHTEISDLIDYGFYSDYLTYSTYALPVLLSTLDEDPFYYNSLYTCGENISFRYNEEQYYKEMDYHKRFSFTKAEKGDNVWGNSTPVLAFMNQVYDASWADKPINYMNTDYFGRLGEMHKADNYLVDWSVYIDDELWYDASNTALGSWTYDFIYQDYEPASIDVHLENTNVLVDGIDGHNIADIHQEWSLPESDDHIAPTLQMLMMRDSEDNITDRFKKAEDGFMEFCGADFQYYYSEEPWLFYFYEQPMEVTVEYAPYGSTEWEEVTGTEVIDEYFQMPTFGYFYRTPLASVDRKSANGWFDLRFTLTDAAGNKQVQELSPAFHIDELSGLNSINASSADVVKVEYYDLQGRKVSNPNAGLYIKISTKADGSSTTQKVALN